MKQPVTTRRRLGRTPHYRFVTTCLACGRRFYGFTEHDTNGHYLDHAELEHADGPHLEDDE